MANEKWGLLFNCTTAKEKPNRNETSTEKKKTSILIEFIKPWFLLQTNNKMCVCTLDDAAIAIVCMSRYHIHNNVSIVKKADCFVCCGCIYAYTTPSFKLVHEEVCMSFHFYFIETLTGIIKSHARTHAHPTQCIRNKEKEICF